MRGGHGGHNVFTRQLLIWVVTALLLGVCGWSSGLLVTYALDVTMMTASPSPPGGGSAAARSPAQKQSKKGKKGNAGSGKAKPAPAAQKPQAVPRPLMHTPVVTEQAGVHDDEEAIPASTQEPDTPAVVQTRPTAVIGESDARKEHAEMEMLAKEHGSEDDTKVVERTAEEKVGLMTKEQLADILRSHGKGGGDTVLYVLRTGSSFSSKGKGGRVRVYRIRVVGLGLGLGLGGLYDRCKVWVRAA